MTTEILRPGDPGYDESRRVWNAMVDRRPAVVVRCRTVADVVLGLDLAARDGLEVGIRCGGHSIVGHAVPDGGLMLDLRPLASVRVDPEARRAWVQGGALLGALDDATQVHGLATTAGNVSHTGVGGLALGGGMGWLAREHGLTCDNLVSCEVVTAAGDVVRASETENPELFWGLRGGGGNFGVATDFELRLHDTGTRALTVEHDFPAAESAERMARWRDLSAEAPRNATYTANVHGGTAVFGFVWVGDPEAGREHARGVDGLGPALDRRVVECSYGELQRRDDTVEAHDVRRYWKGHYLPELTDGAIEAFLAHDPDVPASLQAYGGAISDVAAEATAFGRRDTTFEYVGAARWLDPAEDDERMAVARASAARLEPFAVGAYVNAMGDDDVVSGVTRAYPPAQLTRLTALKDAVDPGNVFHLNQNIAPT